ncbi:hypothetical protein D3C78_1885000 [compost metagenome]
MVLRLGSCDRAIEQTCSHSSALNSGRSSGCRNRSALGLTMKVKERSPDKSRSTTTVEVW